MKYSDYIYKKLAMYEPVGLDVSVSGEQYGLFDHQKALVQWGVKKGRCAIFADTGLGKSRMQLAWADIVHKQTGGDVLILAPLAVAEQTRREGSEIGVSVNRCNSADEVQPGINITNYEKIHRFDCSRFKAVILDESSVIKHHTAKTFSLLAELFARTPYKLCATATPAPNDWTELGTHAEFLGVCSRTEMLAEYFIHDAAKTQDWRLKGHAKDLFWKWVSTWGAMVRKPSDLGFDDGRYNLPTLNVQEHHVLASMEDAMERGFLFPMEAGEMSERRQARKSSLEDRVNACAEIVNGNDRPWIIWCDLNAEGEALRAAIPDAVEIAGSHDSDVKEKRLMEFSDGKIRVLVTKPSIAGWGLNWQHCRDMAFVGVTDSFEAYYQAVRRCWRFGQTMPVNVHIFASEAEGSIVANLKRKERDANAMGEALSQQTRASVQEQVLGAARTTNTYKAESKIQIPAWLQTEVTA